MVITVTVSLELPNIHPLNPHTYLYVRRTQLMLVYMVIPMATIMVKLNSLTLIASVALSSLIQSHRRNENRRVTIAERGPHPNTESPNLSRSETRNHGNIFLISKLRNVHNILKQ